MPEPSILPIVNAVGVDARDRRAHALARDHRHRRWSSSSSRSCAGSAPRRTRSPSSRSTTPRTSCHAPIGFARGGRAARRIVARRLLAERYAQAFAAHLERGRRERPRRGVRARARGGRGAVQRARLRRRPPQRADGRAGLRARRPPGRDRPRRRGVPAREPLHLRDRGARLPRGAGDRAHRARVHRAAARAGRRLGGDQLLAERRGDPPADRRRGPRGARRRSARRSRSWPPSRGARRSARPRRRSSRSPRRHLRARA